MATGFQSINKPARRRSRNLKVALEPLFQFRDRETTFRREGIVKPAVHLLAKLSDGVSTLTNPAYLQITPAFENEEPLDIKESDLFLRLKYLDGEDTTDDDAIAHATRTRVHHSLEVHSFEIRYQMFRIIGDLT